MTKFFLKICLRPKRTGWDEFRLHRQGDIAKILNDKMDFV